MKACLSVSALRRAMTIACRAVERRNTIPILSFARLTVQPGTPPTLVIETTNLDMLVSLRVPLASGEPGTVTAPAHSLLRIAMAYPGADFLAMSTFDDRIRVDFADARFSLLSLAATDFPDLPKLTQGFGSAMQIVGLARAFARLTPFISDEETRYYLNGICLLNHRGKLTGVATNGHTLGCFGLDGDGWPLGDHKIIVPRHAVALIRKSFQPTSTISLAFAEPDITTVRFSCDDVTVTTKLIDGTFPDFQRIIPTDGDYTWRVDGASLLAKLDRARVLSGRRGRAIAIRFDGTAIVGSTEALDDRVSIALPGTMAGPKRDLGGFNIELLRNAVRCLPAGEIELQFVAGSNTPVKLVKGDDVALVMPLRGYSEKAEALPDGAAP